MTVRSLNNRNIVPDIKLPDGYVWAWNINGHWDINLAHGNYNLLEDQIGRIKAFYADQKWIAKINYMQKTGRCEECSGSGFDGYPLTFYFKPYEDHIPENMHFVCSWDYDRVVKKRYGWKR